MEYHFDYDVAKDVGVNAAVIYYNIKYWCDHSRKNGVKFHDGYYWTFNSIKAFAKQFEFLTEKQIRTALDTLEEKGYIKTDNFNDTTYDRTKWYADIKVDKVEVSAICPTGQMDLPLKENGFAPEGEPIPNINTNTKPNNKLIEKEIYKEREVVEKPKRKKFVPPTLEEVKAYCLEKGLSVNAERFLEYYQAGDWKDAKGNTVKSWKQKLLTWEGRNNDNTPRYISNSRSNNNKNCFGEMLKNEGYSAEDIVYGKSGDFNFT